MFSMAKVLTWLFAVHVLMFLCRIFNGESFDIVVRSTYTEVSLSYLQWRKF